MNPTDITRLNAKTRNAILPPEEQSRPDRELMTMSVRSNLIVVSACGLVALSGWLMPEWHRDRLMPMAVVLLGVIGAWLGGMRGVVLGASVATVLTAMVMTGFRVDELAKPSLVGLMAVEFAAGILLGVGVSRQTAGQGTGIERQGEAFNREVMNALNMQVVILDPVGNVVMGNEAWKRFGAGSGEDEVVAERVEKYFASFGRAIGTGPRNARILDGIRAVVSGERDYFAGEYCADCGKELNWYQLHASRIGSQGGGTVVVHEDITVKKRVEEQMVQHRAELELIFDSVPALIFYKDTNGRLLRVNDELARMIGMEKSAIEGRTDAELGSPYAKDHYAEDRVVIETEVPMRKKLEMLHTVSGPRWIETDKIPHRDRSGRIVGIIGFAVDVTEKRKAEEALKALNEELEERIKARTAALEEANRELESFSYSVSHDLRAPLRAIDGFSQALVDDFGGSIPEGGQRFLSIIRSSTQRMGQLIDELLAFSRLSRQPIVRGDVDMAKLVSEVMSEPGLGLANVAEVVIGDLPRCEGDQGLLRQVWMNLISNGLKYSAKRESPRVEIGSMHVGRECVYFVRDNGAGFDMRFAGKLFGVFQRLHRSDEFEGTGVGLAIVQRIVKRHGGRVWGEGAVNRGATFYFTTESESKA